MNSKKKTRINPGSSMCMIYGNRYSSPFFLKF